jgi:3-phenylpropionate/trans-cinnamate dioxygenase ferredoxin subunit
MAEFRTVARLEDVPPGERLVVEYGREWVVIFNVDHTLYALEDRCSHEDVPLSDGMVHGCEVECAKHGARFDLRDGRAMAPPAFAPVRRYEVRVVDGDVQVRR